MFFVISPAKNLNEIPEATVSEYTQPALLKRSVELLPLLKAMAPQDLAKLMGISDKLAVLNVRRFAEWHLPFTTENAKQAVYLFDGDVYEGLHANTLPESAIHYLQQHLGILSACMAFCGLWT